MMHECLCRSLSRSVGAALLLLMVAAGCDGASAQTTPSAPHRFQLDGQRLAIELPPHAAIRVAPDGKDVRIDVRPSTRQPTAISLRPLPEGEAAERFDRTEALGGSRSLMYRISAASVGSGGPEAFLDGHLTLAGHQYIVTCHVQGDSIALDDAVWCLPYLRTLTVVDAEAK
jgi:hypothetical protein